MNATGPGWGEVLAPVSAHICGSPHSPPFLSFTASCTCFRLNTQSLSFSPCNGGFSETGVLWLFIFAFPHLATRGVLGMFIKLKTLCNRCPAWDHSLVCPISPPGLDTLRAATRCVIHPCSYYGTKPDTQWIFRGYVGKARRKMRRGEKETGPPPRQQ